MPAEPGTAHLDDDVGMPEANDEMARRRWVLHRTVVTGTVPF
jgi:hypothetical protein